MTVKHWQVEVGFSRWTTIHITHLHVSICFILLIFITLMLFEKGDHIDRFELMVNHMDQCFI